MQRRTGEPLKAFKDKLEAHGWALEQKSILLKNEEEK